jgi:hypothetical protein
LAATRKGRLWLSRHVLIHSGVRRNTCPLSGCGKAFETADGLERHLQSHFRHGKRKDSAEGHSDKATSGAGTATASTELAAATTPSSAMAASPLSESPQACLAGGAAAGLESAPVVRMTISNRNMALVAPFSWCDGLPVFAVAD